MTEPAKRPWDEGHPGGPGGPGHTGGPGGTARSAPAIMAPPVIVALIGLLALIHLGRQFLSPNSDIYLLQSLAFIPARFSGDPLSYGSGLLFGALGPWLTLVSHTLLHADWVHLLFNCFWLLAFGTAVVRRLGTARFLVLYLLAAVGGAGLQLAFNVGSPVPVIGASGAIFGLIGAGARFVLTEARMSMHGIRLITPPPLAPLTDSSVLAFVTVCLALNFLMGVAGMPFVGEGQAIAWEAHMGGFLTGLFLIGFLDRH